MIEPHLFAFCYFKNKLMPVFCAFNLLLMINFAITLSKFAVDMQLDNVMMYFVINKRIDA